MKSEFLMIAQSSSVDNPTNQLSIFNIIDDFEIGVQLNPGSTEFNIPIGLQLICSLLRDETDKKSDFETTIKLLVKNPNSQILFVSDLPIKFEPQHVRNRVRVGVNIGITASGNYSIEIQSEKGHIIASKNLKIDVKTSSV